MAFKGNFVVGRLYYAYCQLDETQSFIGEYQGSDQCLYLFRDNVTEKTRSVQGVPYFDFFEYDETTELPAQTGDHLFLAFQVLNGIGMGDCWNEFFRNKYGRTNVARLTSYRSNRDRGAIGLEYFRYTAFPGVSSMGLGPDLMEDKGRFNYRNFLDFEPLELTRGQKVAALQNAVANFATLENVVRVLVQDDRILVEYRSFGNTRSLNLSKEHPSIDAFIRGLKLNIGTYLD
mgnify:CR=1 FL=1